MPDHILHNEKELLLQIAEGDEMAFQALFNRYVPLLLPYLLEMAKSRQAAEDIIQNTFIRIWLQRDKLETVEYPRTWITRIAVHECLNMLRRQQTEKKALYNWQERTDTRYEPDMQYQQTRKFVNEAVSQLSPQRRRIYEMSRTGGQSVTEIAGELGLSVQTVKNTLGISLEFIREYLRKKGVIIPSVLLLEFFLNFFKS